MRMTNYMVATVAIALAGPALTQAQPPKAPDFMLRATAADRAAGLNRMLDTDRDGVVSRAEVDGWALGKAIPAGAVEAMFTDADTNRDGRITLDEQTADALRSFDEADTDHDGRLTVPERDAAERKLAAQPTNGAAAPLPPPTRKR